MTANPTLKVSEIHAENLAEFITRLDQHRFWRVLPRGEKEPTKATHLFDAKTGRCIELGGLHDFLRKHAFIHIQSLHDGNQNLATLQSEKRVLWTNEGSNERYSFVEGRQFVAQQRWAGLENWILPTKSRLESFAKSNLNPYRKDQAYRMMRKDGLSECYWLTAGGKCDVDEGYWGVESGMGSIFACNTHWENTSDTALLFDLLNRDWKLVSRQGDTFPPSQLDPQDKLGIEALLASWAIENQTLLSESENSIRLNPRDYWIDMQFIDLDYVPCRLPKLDDAQLTDPEKGLWELWGEEEATLKKFNYVARDPARDIQRRAVAIDFGTSSTVVAMDTASGKRELLRIGVRDFFETVRPGHFENPTVLELLDFTAFHNAWTATAYRPALDWEWTRAAHEAQASFRDNPGNTDVLSSILPRLKQWALRSSEHRRVRLTDRQQPARHEIELAPHTERNPTRGQPLTVCAQDPFDPIELYAWYLGMAINWRGRGLFLKYYLSFPVKYPREVKARILASFRRGLQRSLPASLIQHHPQVLHEFAVEDLASEPAAYAAAALPRLGVEPTDEGVPYAVFDFGGGTSDFDYGLLRWATPEEEDQGYERVFEHLASDGDNFLGGENLLEHLVYESFKNNLPVLREKRIQFTQPIDGQPFAGSEAFLAPTQAAQTNAVMLAAKLRDFLEKDEAELLSQIKLDLIDGNGHKQTCVLNLNAEALDALLAHRIRRGTEAFLAGLARLRAELPAGAPIHVLLAGNGSRSRHVKALFDTHSELWPQLLEQAFGEGQAPEIVVHPPLPMDEADPHAPTTKTGVALGLLRLAPGESTLLKNHLHVANDGQAPFAWFAGRLRRGRFEPAIAPNVAYGEWRELGALQQGVFSLFVTASPRAHNGLPEGDPELRKHRLDFPAAQPGARVFARAAKPHLLELAAAPDLASLAVEGLDIKSLPLE